jgi:cellulose synthase/poly-beta-1,6-N-acetylglucosamine synthase-like glycosyltransferase
MPVRDGAATVAEAIVSIQRQTLADWELVVVDDGSTDDTLRIISELQCTDPRVRLLRLPASGIVQALNTGVAAARGGIIARMDADDISHPRRLERQLDLMRADPILAMCGAHVEDMPGAGEGRRRYSNWVNSHTSHDDIVREILVECPVAHPTFMMRRDELERAGGYRDMGWPEDHDLVLRMWRAGMRFAATGGEPLLAWRDAPGRLSRRDPRYSAAAFRACRMHHLLRSPLLPPGRAVAQWGAGAEGKAWLRAWPPELRPQFVVEVDPRKTGRTIHGVRVVALTDVGGPSDALLVVAVGAAGARGEIRRWLAPRGWVEWRDFVFVA